MITPFIKKCETLGNGVDPKAFEELRLNIITPQIVERTLADNDYSYFPVGHRTGRIFKIVHGKNGRLYLEMNHVELISQFPSLWKLNDEERKFYHASGVVYCFYGEDRRSYDR